MTKNIVIGDRIIFKAQTRFSNEKVMRVVNGFYDGKPTVRYASWPNFIVNPNEISNIIKAGKI